MTWPLGRFSAGVKGEGQLVVQAPAGTTVLGRDAPVELTQEEEGLGKPWGPVSPARPLAARAGGREPLVPVRPGVGGDRREPVRDGENVRRVPGAHGGGRALRAPPPPHQRPLR